MRKHLAVLTLAALCGWSAFADAVQTGGDRLIRFVNAPVRADISRLPTFRSSDTALDRFWNDYFMRHLSVDPSGVYWGTGPQLGATDHLWVIEWDQWMLPWIDRAAMGRERQMGSDVDVILTTLSRCTIDKYGYVFGAFLTHEPNDSLGGYKPTFGWPWPKYNRNYTVSRPTGWEFNDLTDAAHEGWSAEDLRLDSGHPDHRLKATVTGANPKLISPQFACEACQIPILEVDIEYRSKSGEDVRNLVNGLRIYWKTEGEAEFTGQRSVGTGFSVLPPQEFPDDYAEMSGRGFARYPLFFPMYLHPQWGGKGRRITQLMIVPCGTGGQDTEIAVNYVRATYDVRMATTNAALINAAARFYLWNGDRDFLRNIMPRLRRAMLFMNVHLRGKRDGLICQDWFVGHDGRGGDQSGHGMIGSYWDLLPSGRYDLESSSAYYLALENMAALEDACLKHGIECPSVAVMGPDDRTRMGYRESAASLRKHAERVRRKIEAVFWIPETGRFCRNIDADGRRHDYGFLHLNVQAVAWGIGTPEQVRGILSWLDGRHIPGDTAIGADIYRWRFAPRTSTRRNTDYYFWPWIWDWRAEVGSPFRVWGDQMQDGGAIPATALWEAMARRRSGRREQADRVLARCREVSQWYGDVAAAGGQGPQLYRAYYDGHPERGKQQSPMPGGLGLDREFLSDGSLGTAVPFYAFIGADTSEDGVLTIRPCVPAGLDFVEVSNIAYRGRLLTIRVGHDHLKVIATPFARDEARLRLLLPMPAPEQGIIINDAPVRYRNIEGRAEVLLPLSDAHVRWRMSHNAARD